MTGGVTTVGAAPPENCDECGFRWDTWSDEQARGILSATGPLLGEVLEGVSTDLADRRPAPDRWSILEYVDHIRSAMWLWRFASEAAVGEPGIDLRTDGPPSPGAAADRSADVASAIEAAGAEANLLTASLGALASPAWSTTALVNAGGADQAWILRHALHEALHHIHDVGRVRTELGDGVPTQRGRVAQLNVSDGGVPKSPVHRIEVTATGVVGDRQDDTRHHGRPVQALCLWGVDVIEALRAEGHPIHAGEAGENVTVDGLRWADIRPGAIVAIGDGVRIEISAYSTPCAKNARWFADRDHRRIDHDRHPGWSRLYATVHTPGAIAVGDEVVVEP